MAKIYQNESSVEGRIIGFIRDHNCHLQLF